MKKSIALILALLMMVVLFAGCQKDPVQTTPPSSTPVPTVAAQTAPPIEDATNSVVVDMVSHASRNNSWDVSPWKNNGNGGNTIWYQLYSCLMANPAYGTRVEDMHYDMAESIEFSADKMSATIKMRDYIHDSKGNPITADDVVFSYKTAPTIGPTYAKINNYMSSMVAVDEYTLEMTINTSAPGTWESLLSYVPIVSQSWYEGASDEEKANDPACTGAYHVIENIVGVRTLFEAVEDFWQKDELRSFYQIVNVKRINYVAILESTMRAIALENGELDSAFIDSAGVELFQDNPEFVINEYWMLNPNTMVLNCSENSPFYDNPALRKAVMHAVDWHEVAIPVSGVKNVRGHDTAPMLCSDFDLAWNDQPYFDYDPELAKQYFAEAGYNENSGLTLTYITRSNPEQLSAATIVQSYLKAIGIDLVFDGLDQGIYDAYQTDPTKWDMCWYTQSMPGGFVTESWIYYFGNRGEGGNASFLKDETLQKLLETALLKNDEASKTAFREYAIDLATAANISNEPVYYVSRKGIEQFAVSFLINPALNACIYSEDY